jgi:hypothetical protein
LLDRRVIGFVKGPITNLFRHRSRVERADRPALKIGGMTAPAWVTVQRCSATVRMALRATDAPFASAVNVRADDPVPARGFGCSQDAFVVALHSHSLAAVT